MFIDYSNPSHVVITHRGTKLTGSIFSDNDYDWRLHINVETDYYPANILNIDYSKFIKNVLGYSKGNNNTNSKEDLIKVLDALNEEYEKKFGESVNPEYLKDGDIVYITKNYGNFKAIYIVKEIIKRKLRRYVFYSLNDNTVDIDEKGYLNITNDAKIKYATDSEKKLLFSTLAEKGLIWNPNIKQIQKVQDCVSSLYAISLKDSDLVSYAKLDAGDYLDEVIVDSGKTYKVEYPKQDQTITIKDFIKSKKHYQFNFNN